MRVSHSFCILLLYFAQFRIALAFSAGKDAAGLLSEPFLESRRSNVASFKVMDVLARATELESQGRKIYHLEVGQPSSGAPSKVVAAATAALSQDRIGYTHALGISPLRKRISQHYKDKYGVDVDPERIIVTTGSSAGFLIAFLAAFDAGDSVALCSAGYPCYRNILNALGCEVTTVPINAESKVTQKELKEVVDAGKKPRGLILSSPSNPTGAMLSPEELRGLCEYCEQEGILFISDEIYHGISFGKEEETALKFSDKCMVINSFSKYYSMTGWRLGWMVMPPGLVDAGNRLAQNLYINAPTLSQLAAVEAFDCEAELEAHVARYAENRRVVLAALDDMGVTSRAPSDGAFYVYADVGRFTRDAEGLCRRALEEAGVAFTPGTDFEDPAGPVGGSRVRFSFCGSTRDVREGMEALTQWWLKEFEEVLSTVQKELS
mmetsp:Transcript_46534/g.80186  ORF Transcript_46534/g.80186 Transcript_46534/m.80186 type:complete len:436 (+) Transcript_46534:80-1387(+)